MITSYDKGSLEVFYNDGSDKLVKQTYSNLNEGVTDVELQPIHAALSSLGEYPIEEFIVVERTRHASL